MVSVTWLSSEAEAISSINCEQLKQVLIDNPLETVLDLEDSELSEMRVYRARVLQKNGSEVYYELSERIATICRENNFS